jgi:hypothetical protein
MITTPDAVIFHDTRVQGHLPMGTSILQGEGLALPRAAEHNRFASKRNRTGFSGFHLAGASYGVPETRIDPRLADVPQRRELLGT